MSNYFDDLFIFEMANNHQGQLEHGLRIIREMGTLVREYGLKAAVKLQFRNLDNFVHPEIKAQYEENPENCSNHHVKRFLSTRLSQQEFQQFVFETRNQGMIPMCTPFDEDSVDTIHKMGIEIIKIGSPSLRDWTLLEKCATSGKPVIISSGGLTTSEVDQIVDLFEKHNAEFALMHCVSIYPTPEEQLELNTVTHFRERYPDVPIGFSTHEDPNNFEAIKVATLLGAKLYEKHVGVPDEEQGIKLNAYSANPEQARKWIESYLSAKRMIGRKNIHSSRNPTEKEAGDLQLLSRGIYLRHPVSAGEEITDDDVYYAFPIADGGLNLKEYVQLLRRNGGKITATHDYAENDALTQEVLPDNLAQSIEERITELIYDARTWLTRHGIRLPKESKVELSHHYGLENFERHGCLLIEFFATDYYAKKLLVILPGQTLPEHFHRIKDESFHLIDGILKVKLEGEIIEMSPGDVVRAKPGMKHEFTTDTGCIFEEISTGIVPNDSFYSDGCINNNPDRKTLLQDWKMVSKL